MLPDKRGGCSGDKNEQTFPCPLYHPTKSSYDQMTMILACYRVMNDRFVLFFIIYRRRIGGRMGVLRENTLKQRSYGRRLLDVIYELVAVACITYIRVTGGNPISLLRPVNFIHSWLSCVL